MKKVYLLITVLIFAFIISCGDEIIDAPLVEEDNWIQLPDNPALGDTTQFDVTSEIVGSSGGSLEFVRDFPGGPFGQYCVSAKLRILSGTFADNDTIDFTLSVDASSASVVVSPIEDYFNKPLKLSLTYCGIDLSGLDPCDLDFVYSNGKDSVISIYYDDVDVDTLTGRLEVINAHLEYIPNPFPAGRFGWVRKAL